MSDLLALRELVSTTSDGVRVERQWAGHGHRCMRINCGDRAEWVYVRIENDQLVHEGIYCSIRCRVMAANHRASQTPTDPLPPKPRYLEAAESFAKNRGISTERFMEELRTSTAGLGPDCLEPHEVDCAIDGEDLPAARQAHVDACEDCRAHLRAFCLPKDT